MTKTEFVNDCSIPESLTKAVIKQIGGWESFKEYAQDVTNHGASAGFSGFIYYRETIAFTVANKLEILAYAKEQANEYGLDGAYSMIAGFNALKGMDITADSVAECMYDEDHEDYIQVFNILAWYMLEEVSRDYSDMLEG